jgi:hypothetical protein
MFALDTTGGERDLSPLRVALMVVFQLSRYRFSQIIFKPEFYVIPSPKEAPSPSTNL